MDPHKTKTETGQTDRLTVGQDYFDFNLQNLVMGAGWVADTKIDWPNDHRLQVTSTSVGVRIAAVQWS
jgi:hypothetical protein